MQEINGKEQKRTVAELIRTQRATRQYSQQAVSEEDIHTVLNAGRRAQSSRNNQPWYFIVVRDRERLQGLAESGAHADHVARAAFAIALVTSNSGAAAGPLWCSTPRVRTVPAPRSTAAATAAPAAMVSAGTP